MDFSCVYSSKSVLQVSIFLEGVSSEAGESVGVFHLNKKGKTTLTSVENEEKEGDSEEQVPIRH